MNSTRRNHQLVAISLLGVAAALIFVGVVSRTILRHLVQCLPVIAAIPAIFRRPAWGPYAAIAVLVFWLFIMSLIWLYLLGLARIVTGHFRVEEIILTISIGLFSIGGLMGCAESALHPPAPSRIFVRAAAFAIFAALQIGAMWISLRGPIANH